MLPTRSSTYHHTISSSDQSPSHSHNFADRLQTCRTERSKQSADVRPLSKYVLHGNWKCKFNVPRSNPIPTFSPHFAALRGAGLRGSPSIVEHVLQHIRTTTRTERTDHENEEDPEPADGATGLPRIIHHALPAGCSLTQNTYEQSLAHDESDPTAHLRPGSIPRPGCFFSFAPPFRPDWAAGVIGYIATSRRCISTHSALSG